MSWKDASWKKIAWRVAMLALFAFAGWEIYQAMGGSLKELSVADFTQWKPAVLPLTVSVVVVALVNLLHAFLWRRIATDLGCPRPGTRVTVHVYFVSGLSKYIYKMAQMPGLAVLAARFGLPAGRATAAAILGQLVYLVTGVLFLFGVAPSLIDRINPDAAVNPAWIALLLAFITVALVWVVVATPVGLAIRRWTLERVKGRLGERLSSGFSMIDEVRPKDAAVWAAGYFVSWVVLVVGFVLFTVAFYPEAAGHGRFVAGALVASVLIGNFSPAQAGLGRELPLALLLSAVMPETVAAVIAILSRLWFMSGELLPLILIPMLRKPPEIAPTASAVLL